MQNTRFFSFKPIWVLLAALLFSSCSITFSTSAGRSKAPVVTPVNDWLYRGSQPREGDFARIKGKGVRTVVNFRDESHWIQWEKEKVEALGMKYVSLPWNVKKPVKPELLDRFFAVLDDPKNRPVYFHCQYGRDRSGVMTTLALMRYQNLSKEEAREEALETIRPSLLQKGNVSEKIDFFLRERPAAFQKSSRS